MTEENSSIDFMSFEQAFAELESIIARLENETPTLQESMQLFERGQLLAGRCASLLENAQLKVQTLTNLRPAGDSSTGESLPTE